MRITWNRIFGLMGLIGLAVFVYGASHHSGQTCGALLVNRWSVPYAGMIAGILLISLTLLLAAWRLSAQKAAQWGQRLIVAGFGLGLGLGLLELGIRIIPPPVTYPTPFYQNDDRMGYFFVPNARHRALLPDWRTAVFRTDSSGFIIRDGNNTPRAEAERLLFIGDSFVEGLQVMADENMSVVAADSLGASAGTNVQSLNLGVSGYSPIQYRLVYEAFSRDFDPDTVIAVFYVGNDFADTIKLVEEDRLIYDDHENPVAVKHVIKDGKVWIDPAKPLEEASARGYLVPPEQWSRGVRGLVWWLTIHNWCESLNNLQVQKALQQDQVAQSTAYQAVGPDDSCDWCASMQDFPIGENDLAIFKPAYSEQDQEQIAYVMGTIEQLANEVEADGHRFVLVIMPVNNQVPGQGESYKSGHGLAPDQIIGSRKPQDVILNYCDSAGLTCLDLLPVLVEHANEALYWSNEVHLTPRGQALVGQTIAEFLFQTP